MKISMKELAGILEVSISGLKNWIQEGLPQAGRGQFDLRAVVSWVRKNKPLFESESNLTEERTKLVRAQRRIKELEAEIKEGALIPRESVLNEFLSRIHAVRTGLLSLDRALCISLEGLTVREAAIEIKKQCYSLLEKFSRGGGVLGNVKRTKVQKINSRKQGGDEKFFKSDDPGRSGEVIGDSQEAQEVIERGSLLRGPGPGGSVSGEVQDGQSAQERVKVIPETVKPEPIFNFPKSQIRSMFESEEMTILAIRKAIGGGVTFERDARGLPICSRVAFMSWWNNFLSGKSDAEKKNHLQRYPE